LAAAADHYRRWHGEEGREDVTRLRWGKGYSFFKYSDKLYRREIAERVGVSVDERTKKRWGSSTSYGY